MGSDGEPQVAQTARDPLLASGAGLAVGRPALQGTDPPDQAGTTTLSA